MKSIRIGNDINVAWSLLRDDAPFLLNKETISLFLHTPFGRMELTDYSVKGNVISWVFFGKNQKAIGKYSLILVINKGKEGMITTDACDFVNLVSCSCKVDGDDSCGVVTEYVNLVSKVDVGGSGGGSSYDDTEIRTELSRLERDKADKSELTELSAEVGGLSERIDNLPTAEDEILVVEYGKTTFQEVYDAYTSGKYVVLEYQNNVFHINRVTTSDIYFISVLNGMNVYRIGLGSSNNWYQNAYQNEQSTNKVTSLSSASTDTQYPSAKAVYEAIQQSGGGGGSSVTPDWNAKEGEVGYIENRTHYYYETVIEDFTDYDQGNDYVVPLTEPYDRIVVTVRNDYGDYPIATITLTPSDTSASVLLDDTDGIYAYAYAEINGEELRLSSDYDYTQQFVKVQIISEKKIDDKYLPDYASKEYVDSVIDAAIINVLNEEV